MDLWLIGYMPGGHSVPPARPASPLPPNVPTGPRNQNKYKDRDNNAQAVDGLDYGGGGGGGGGGGSFGVVMDRGGGTPVDYDDRTGR
jgi:pre-mRNA 3'-end-processing factor FIP1